MNQIVSENFWVLKMKAFLHEEEDDDDDATPLIWRRWRPGCTPFCAHMEDSVGFTHRSSSVFISGCVEFFSFEYAPTCERPVIYTEVP